MCQTRLYRLPLRSALETWKKQLDTLCACRLSPRLDLDKWPQPFSQRRCYKRPKKVHERFVISSKEKQSASCNTTFVFPPVLNSSLFFFVKSLGKYFSLFGEEFSSHRIAQMNHVVEPRTHSSIPSVYFQDPPPPPNDHSASTQALRLPQTMLTPSPTALPNAPQPQASPTHTARHGSAMRSSNPVTMCCFVVSGPSYISDTTNEEKPGPGPEIDDFAVGPGASTEPPHSTWYPAELSGPSATSPVQCASVLLVVFSFTSVLLCC